MSFKGLSSTMSSYGTRGVKQLEDTVFKVQVQHKTPAGNFSCDTKFPTQVEAAWAHDIFWNALEAHGHRKPNGHRNWPTDGPSTGPLYPDAALEAAAAELCKCYPNWGLAKAKQHLKDEAVKLRNKINARAMALQGRAEQPADPAAHDQPPAAAQPVAQQQAGTKRSSEDGRPPRAEGLKRLRPNTAAVSVPAVKAGGLGAAGTSAVKPRQAPAIAEPVTRPSPLHESGRSSMTAAALGAVAAGSRDARHASHADSPATARCTLSEADRLQADSGVAGNDSGQLSHSPSVSATSSAAGRTVPAQCRGSSAVSPLAQLENAHTIPYYEPQQQQQQHQVLATAAPAACQRGPLEGGPRAPGQPPVSRPQPARTAPRPCDVSEDTVLIIESRMHHAYRLRFPPKFVDPDSLEYRASALLGRDMVTVCPSPQLLGLLYAPRDVLTALWRSQCWWNRQYRAQHEAFQRRDVKAGNVEEARDGDVQQISLGQGCQVLVRHGPELQCHTVKRLRAVDDVSVNWLDGRPSSLPPCEVELDDGSRTVPLGCISNRPLSAFTPEELTTAITRQYCAAQGLVRCRLEPHSPALQRRDVLGLVYSVRSYFNAARFVEALLLRKRDMLDRWAHTQGRVDLTQGAACLQEFEGLISALRQPVPDDLVEQAQRLPSFLPDLDPQRRSSQPQVELPAPAPPPEQQPPSAEIRPRGAVTSPARSRPSSSPGQRRGIASPHQQTPSQHRRRRGGLVTCHLFRGGKIPVQNLRGMTHYHNLQGERMTLGQAVEKIEQGYCLNCFEHGHKRQECVADPKEYEDSGRWAIAQPDPLPGAYED